MTTDPKDLPLTDPREIRKLLAFFHGPIFPALDEAERSRLRNQARFMDGYAAVLEERIAAFEQPTQTPVEHQPV